MTRAEEELHTLDNPPEGVFLYYCHHGINRALYGCGKCEMELLRRKESLMMTIAFEKLTSVLESLEQRLD